VGTPLTIRSTNDLIYSYMLGSAYKTAWVYNPSLSESKDADLFTEMLADADLASSVDRHIKSIVRPWHVETPRGSKNKKDKELAGVVQHALDLCENFDDSRERLALCDILGRTYEVATWELQKVRLGDLPAMEWYIPVWMRNLYRRRVHWETEYYDAGEGVKRKIVTKRIWDTDRNAWIRPSAEWLTSLVEFINDDREERLGYGRGHIDSMYFYDYFKRMGFQKLQEGIDRWANGIVVGKVDGLRNASVGKTNTDLRNSMRDVIRNMRSEHIVVLEKGDEIEVIEGGDSGIDHTMKVVDRMAQSIERLLNGSVRPSGHGMSDKSGARAQAETESDSKEEFFQPMRAKLDRVLTRTVIRAFLYFNQPALRKLGLGDDVANCPRLLSEQKDKLDPMSALTSAQGMRTMGLELVKSEVYEKTGWAQPDADDETLEGEDPIEMMEAEAKIQAKHNPPRKGESK